MTGLQHWVECHPVGSCSSHEFVAAELPVALLMTHNDKQCCCRPLCLPAVAPVQDCPSVCKCGYPTPHSPAECPGLCTRCLNYGHTSKECRAEQCSSCLQRGQGCTPNHCVDPEFAAATGTAAAGVANAQQQAAVPGGSSSSAAQQGSDNSGVGGGFAGPHGSSSSSISVGPPGASPYHQQQQNHQQQQQQPTPPLPPPLQQQHSGRSVVVAGVSVQLESLSTAEDARRRSTFLNWLIDSPRPEFNVFASTLVEAPEKIAVLIRVPGPLLKGKVLPSKDAVPQMEAICAQVLESGSTNSSASVRSLQPAVSGSGQQPAGNGSVGDGGSHGAGGSNGSGGASNGSGVKQTLGQILLPGHAAEFEAALPRGFLKPNWREYTFRELLEKIRWALLSACGLLSCLLYLVLHLCCKETERVRVGFRPEWFMGRLPCQTGSRLQRVSWKPRCVQTSCCCTTHGNAQTCKMQLAMRTPLPPASCLCTHTSGPSAGGRPTTGACQRPGTLSGKPRKQPRQSQMQQGQQVRLAASLAACNSRILVAQRVRPLWLRKQHQGRQLHLPGPAAATAAAAAAPGIGRAQGLTAGMHGLIQQHPTAHQHQAHTWHMHPAAAAAAAFGPQ